MFSSFFLIPLETLLRRTDEGVYCAGVLLSRFLACMTAESVVCWCVFFSVSGEGGLSVLSSFFFLRMLLLGCTSFVECFGDRG